MFGGSFGAHSDVLWYKTLQKFLQVVVVKKLEALGGGRLAFGFRLATTQRERLLSAILPWLLATCSVAVAT